MAKKTKRNNGYGDTVKVIHQIKEWPVYEVTKEELETLSENKNSDIHLSIAISLLSIFLSLGLSLLPGGIDENSLQYTVTFVITCVSFVSGTVFLILWLRNRNKNKKDELMEKILKR